MLLNDVLDTRTPFVQGKIQYTKLLKADNYNAILCELTDRQVAVQQGSKWSDLIALLKQNELECMGDSDESKKFFKPVSNEQNFKVKEN